MAFIHGMMSSNLQWSLHLDDLGQHLRMLLIELPGHGDSPAPDRLEAYGPNEVLPAIDAVRSNAGIDSWWVVSQSLGAAVGFRYALHKPDHIPGIVFTNSRAAFGVSRTSSIVIPETVEGRRGLRFHPIGAKRFPEELQSRMVVAADRMPAYVLEHMREGVPAVRRHRSSRDSQPWVGRAGGRALNQH